MYSFHVGQTYFPLKPSHTVPVRPSSSPPDGKAFQDYLTESVARTRPTRELTFSQHALNRLNERGISLDEAKMDRLVKGVRKAADKGAKESLIMMDNVAYVVSIQNRKVITAVDDGRMKDSVFTNIDSAVFV
ncbi:TIGR02530 family flagellar biosynthesis protein [Brevibacillus borstelensis]|uniref:TIGR02530 family flagellar biosynthesis protein n=1 Tax=Brevibacillus borstelensis TaxID=45462 RepID=UPI0030BD9909